MITQIPIFKPMLIPNFKDAGSSEEKLMIIASAMGAKLRVMPDYIILPKKDGCRIEVTGGELKGRSLKGIKSKWLLERYKAFADKCDELNLTIEGEIYSHEMGFGEISRFFKTPDVTDPKHRKKMEKMDPDDFKKEYYGRSIDWVCSNHDSLKLYAFDVLVGNSPATDISVAEDRLELLEELFKVGGELHEFSDIVVLPERHEVQTFDDLKNLYESFMEQGYEGAVLMHKHSEYKCGRTTIKEATMFKLKDDTLEFDGQIIEVVESTIVDPNAPKTKNELGRSVTSKLQEHRLPSGMAKGFRVMYEGTELTVSLKNYSHERRKDLWENRDDYVGRWIRYKGMEAVKSVPRHAFFEAFRDSK